MTQAVDPGVQSSNHLLTAQDLRKSYGTRVALRSLTFSLNAGRVLGFLGPNGAGKTTAIRILTTILRPSSGQFVVDGISSEQPEKIRRRIGVLPEGLGFPKQLTGFGYLTFYGQLYGRSSTEARTTAQGLLEDVGLERRAHSAIGTYSHGMRQRLGIARALVNDPAVVFFDEPTLGLDPRGQKDLLRLIQSIARGRNKGVVLCSHLLSEIEGICDDVVIMNAGAVVARGAVADVVGQSEADRLRIKVPPASLATARRLLESLPGIESAGSSDQEPGWLDLQVADRANHADTGDHPVRNSVLACLVGADVPVLGFEVGGGRLQDVFLRLTAEAIQ
jgi:ABC-2 type transport system ATP-binding protein